MSELLKLVRAANKWDDGHLTIFKFTSGWKAMLGTPDLDGGTGRDEVAQLPSFPSMEKAAAWALKEYVPDPHLACPNWPNCDEGGCGRE